ncbi:MAG: serine/threonine protein kinase [Pirellulaceae bacterium]|nr:serine/threonine protein kinase [Pirellulaceae bacterium]
MTADRTEQQSSEEQQRSRELSHERAAPPLQIPGYQIRQFLGSGAYGEVWVAIDENTGRRVAIKFYTHRGGLDWSLLSSEVEKLVFLAADRYVVQLLDVGWDATPPYYVMEYVENGSLEDYLGEYGALPTGEAVEIFRDVVRGLLHSHGKGVLHCDLKPANILLDQDNKPRLADFGQSRLSHEQTPALGTLFYMAPEQADLEAVPDARWDVYALGALLYCMLTGEAPYRSKDAISEIDSVRSLDDRLHRYREFLKAHPAANEHRALKGVDGQLANIVDRCLAIDPDERYPNIQSVSDALTNRDLSRDRKPLLILGLLGPLLILMVTAIFGWWGYERALSSSQTLLLKRGKESNKFAADFVSEAVARRIEGYFRDVENVATNPNFIKTLSELTENGEIFAITEQLRGTESPPELRSKLEQHPQRQALQSTLQDLQDKSKQKDIASWFVTNQLGIHLAAAFDSPTAKSSIGRDYSYRTYFHGGPTDHPAHPTPIRQTHLSAVFQSTITGIWKVAVSTPVTSNDGQLLGIVALTVELGRIGEQLDETNERQFTTLVDGREGNSKGVILQHPLFTEILARNETLDTEFSTNEAYRIPLDALDDSNIYRDVLGQHREGANFDQDWIVAKREVQLDPNALNTTGSPIDTDTGLVVIVQENYQNATQPINQLGHSLLVSGLLALGVVVLVVFIIWFLVARALRDPNENVRRNGLFRSSTSTIHSMDTIELPSRMKR